MLYVKYFFDYYYTHINRTTNINYLHIDNKLLRTKYFKFTTP